MTQASVLDLATSKPVRKRTAIVALIVGTLLGLINHGDKLLSGTMDSTNALKIGLTYLVPFSVSLVSSVLALLERQRESQG